MLLVLTYECGIYKYHLADIENVVASVVEQYAALATPSLAYLTLLLIKLSQRGTSERAQTDSVIVMDAHFYL